MSNRKQVDKSSNPRILSWRLSGEILQWLGSLCPLEDFRARDVCACVLSPLSHTSAWKSSWIGSGYSCTIWICRASFIHEFPIEIYFDFFTVLHCEWNKKQNPGHKWKQSGCVRATVGDTSGAQPPISNPSFHNNSRCEAVWQKLILTWPAGLGQAHFPRGST